MTSFKKNKNTYKLLKKVCRLSPKNARLKKELLINEYNKELTFSIRQYTDNYITESIELSYPELMQLIREASICLQNNKESTHELLQEMDHRSLEETLER